MEALATTAGNPKALAAMRRRHLERFTELEAERDTINAELDTLATQHPQQTSPELLSALPLIHAILADLPLKLRYKLYQAASRALGRCGPAYNLQSVNSLPNLPAPRDDQAFVTGGAYALLFLLGALEGLVGCFQFSREVGSFPLVAVLLAVAIGVTCVLGAAGMGSAAGALIPALGWFAVSVLLSLPTAGGSVIITNTTPGEWYLYGGSVCAAVGVIVAFLRRARIGPSRTSMSRRSSFSS